MFSCLRCGSILKTNGSFSVGCADYMWGSGENGGFVRLFYPSNDLDQNSDGCEKPLWLPNKKYGDGMVKYAKMPKWLLAKPFYWWLGKIRLDCSWNGSLHPLDKTNNPKKFPCVIFSHGLGANRLVYSSIAMELASYGYVVAVVEHRDKSASATFYLNEGATSFQDRQWIKFRKVQANENKFQIRNSQLEQRTSECMQTLNFLEQLNKGQPPKNLLGADFDCFKFKDKLDLNHVCIMGHSFGGATAIAALAKDERFKCGIAMDAWMSPMGNKKYSVTQPVLFVNTETFQWKKNVQQIKTFLNIETGAERKMVTIKSTSHLTQSDLPSVAPSVTLRYLGVDSRSMDVHKIIDINRTIIATFLSKYIGVGEEFSDPKILTEDSEHVMIGTNVDV